MSRSIREKTHIIIYYIAIIVALIDQVSKTIVINTMGLCQTIPIVKNIFHITYIHNSGVAFGLFNKYKFLILFFSIVTILFIIFFKDKLAEDKTCLKIGLGFILGGAIGNLVDRLRFQHVIDFIDFKIWPVFNIADSFISIGVIIFILCILLYSKKV